MVSSGGPVENWGDVGGVPIIRILGCIDNPSSSTSCEFQVKIVCFVSYTSPMDPTGLR